MVIDMKIGWVNISCLFIIIVCLFDIVLGDESTGLSARSTNDSNPIDLWYGSKQRFGDLGKPQRWINVLGNLKQASKYNKLTFSLNGGGERNLSLGCDLHRLARDGDFNVELSCDEVKVGTNQLSLTAYSNAGKTYKRAVTLLVKKNQKWPLPYEIDFSKVENLPSVVQIVDGKWCLTHAGVRTVEPYYDRVLSMGDQLWTNYETTVRLTVHDFTPPKKGPPTYNVTHFGVAFRWRGHTQDGLQPSRRWYPLGAQGEFLVRNNLSDCQYRILFGGGKNWEPVYSPKRNLIQLDKPILIKAQVTTMDDGRSRYRFKQWNEQESEPEVWDVEGYEDPSTDYPSGSLCLVPHNTDVTIHHVRIVSLND